jgi:hypothetical protein
MSKDSGLDGIPIPADAVPAKESLPSVPLWNTNVGTISDLVAFYKDYMSGRGWSYDTQYSAIDPDINKAKGLGYVALQNWCSPKTNPPTWDSVIVGVQNPAAADRATTHATQVSLVRLPDTDPCP